MISVSTVGIVAGSGAALLANARCDLWLTGEAGITRVSSVACRRMSLRRVVEQGHHEVLAATESGTSVILCEHSNSERGYISSTMLPELRALFGDEIEILVSAADRDPLTIE